MKAKRNESLHFRYISHYQLTSYPDKVSFQKITNFNCINSIVYAPRNSLNLIDNLYFFNILDPLSSMASINIANPILKKMNPNCYRFVYCLRIKDYLATVLSILI